MHKSVNQQALGNGLDHVYIVSTVKPHYNAGHHGVHCKKCFISEVCYFNRGHTHMFYSYAKPSRCEQNKLPLLQQDIIYFTC